jgi:hypothetical protein
VAWSSRGASSPTSGLMRVIQHELRQPELPCGG